MSFQLEYDGSDLTAALGAAVEIFGDEHRGEVAKSGDQQQFSQETKHETYKKLIESVLLTGSTAGNSHDFTETTTKKPIYCYECQYRIWGDEREMLKCSRCGIKCHAKCKDLIAGSCALREADKNAKRNSESQLDVRAKMIQEHLEKSAHDNGADIQLGQKILNIDSQYHDRILAEAKHGAFESINGSVKITITVVEAKDLAVKGISGKSSDPFATVELGDLKFETKMIDNSLEPVWDETFSLEANNLDDKLCIRLWDKNNSVSAMINEKTTGDRDDFLGQTIINLRTAESHSDQWYLLDKRSEKSHVSGSLHLKIMIKRQGAPAEDHGKYYDLYTCLYDSSCRHYGNDQFDASGQKLTHTFSRHYGIDNSFATILQIRRLISTIGQPSVPKQLSQHLDSIDFKKESKGSNGKILISSLDEIERSIDKLIADYRNAFPARKEDSVNDLKSIIELLEKVHKIRTELNDAHQHNLSETLEHSVKQNANITYGFLANNSDQLYRKRFAKNSETDKRSQGSLKSVEYWNKLLALIVSVIDDDKKVYDRAVGHHLVVVSNVTIPELWNRYSAGLRESLDEHRKSKTAAKSQEYVQLYSKVHWFYMTYVNNGKSSTGQDYVRWFESFFAQWLNDGEGELLESVKKIYESDKQTGFSQASPETHYSVSGHEIPTLLHQRHEIINKIFGHDHEAKKGYMAKYTGTVEKSFNSYSKLIERDYPRFVGDQPKEGALLSDVQHSVDTLDKISGKIGGETSVGGLTQLRVQLEDLIGKLSTASANGNSNSMKQWSAGFRKNLLKTQEQGLQDDEASLNSHLDYLKKLILQYTQSTDHRVMKMLLNKLWVIFLEHYENEVVFPPLKETDRAWSVKHSGVISKTLERAKVLFHADGHGLAISEMDDTPNYKSLQAALKLYQEDAEHLLKKFVNTQNEQLQELNQKGGAIGTIAAEISSKKQENGEHHVEVKVSNISTEYQNPFLGVTLVGPHVAQAKQRKQVKSSHNWPDPNFIAIVPIVIPAGRELSDYEVHFLLKNFRSSSNADVIAVSVFKLDDLVKKHNGQFKGNLPLASQVQMDFVGKTILRILSYHGQNNDTIKHIVDVKSSKRL